MRGNAAIRFMDILISSVLLLIFLPLMLLTALLCSLFIGFPPFYLSDRIGLRGKVYRHFKFRSMKKGPALGREYFEQQRLNGLGRIIRKLHIDELPELLLVLAGKMSLVGPRPLEYRHLKKFDTSVREQVRPGWTGLAQIKLARKGILFGPEQLKLDNIYVRKRSFGYNLKIIAATLRALLSRSKKRNIDPGANWYRKQYLDNFVEKENEKEKVKVKENEKKG